MGKNIGTKWFLNGLYMVFKWFLGLIIRTKWFFYGLIWFAFLFLWFSSCDDGLVINCYQLLLNCDGWRPMVVEI